MFSLLLFLRLKIVIDYLTDSRKFFKEITRRFMYTLLPFRIPSNLDSRRTMLEYLSNNRTLGFQADEIGSKPGVTNSVLDLAGCSVIIA